MKSFLLLVCCGSFVFSASSLRADEAQSTPAVTPVKYTSFDEAMYAERKLRDLDELDERRQTLESAFKLATSPRDQCEAHRRLVPVYALSDDFGLMCESLNYVLENAPLPATASLTLRSAISTVVSKDWEIEFKETYEAQLETNPKDRTALRVLAQVEYLITRDSARHGMYLDRLVALDREESKPVDPEMLILRASAFKYENKNTESAELCETVSREYKDFASYALVKAADSWDRAREFDKSLDAAKRAHQMGPDKRAKQDLYRWHRELGDIFLKRIQPAEAIEHLEAARESARIDAYRQQCDDLLVQANAMMSLQK